MKKSLYMCPLVVSCLNVQEEMKETAKCQMKIMIMVVAMKTMSVFPLAQSNSEDDGMEAWHERLGYMCNVDADGSHA